MEVYINIVLFFLATAVLLYIVLGGADFGAGILELLPFGSKKTELRAIINKAMGPVWEANHMWLIIVVVILFVGFPEVYSTLMITLHIPVVALLFGIVLRGAAFTFRHYDAIQAPKSQRFYSWLFGFSSLWTSMWLGVIAASLICGRIDLEATTFFTSYINPWLGILPLAMGIFVSTIFTFLANIYLLGETNDPELTKILTRRGIALNILVIFTGGLVFFASYIEGSKLHHVFFGNTISIICMAIASVLFVILWMTAKKHFVLLSRAIAAGQCTLILLGWVAAFAPLAIMTNGAPIVFHQTTAPLASLKMLSWSLIIGSCFIFPSLVYLLKVFKHKKK